MIKLGNYFKLLNTPHYFIENDWESFLKILDIVGIWHYSRSYPNKYDYTIEISNKYVLISCNRTNTNFKFSSSWQCRLKYLNSDGSDVNTFTIEGTLFSTFPYIDILIDVKAIKFINPFIYLIIKFFLS